MGGARLHHFTGSNLEPRKLPENAARTHLSTAYLSALTGRCVAQFLMDDTLVVIIGDNYIALIGDTTTPEIGVIA